LPLTDIPLAAPRPPILFLPIRWKYHRSHKRPTKREGTGQSWFPKSWTDKDIRKAGEHSVSLKTNRHKPDGVAVFGTYKGVRVGVIKTNGQIATVFPDRNQPTRKSVKKK